MNIETIKFDEPNHINPFLTHWTGRGTIDNLDESFEIIKKIIDSKKLKLNIISTSYRKNENDKSIETAPWSYARTICFTDTPIKQSKYHCKRYGNFGISFNKEKLIDYGANPVLYIVPNRRVHQDFIITDLITVANENFPSNPQKEIFSWLLGIMQAYDTKSYEIDNWAEFYEREWRIIRPAEQLESQFGKSFNTFFGHIEIEDSKKRPEDQIWFLKFDRTIIENIIVPKSFENNAKKLIKQYDLKCELFLVDSTIMYNF